MEPSSPTATAPVEDVVLVDFLSRITISPSVEHTHARQGRLIPTPSAPPRLSIHFSLLTYPSREPPNDQVNVIFHRSFDLLMQEQAWEREARAMLEQVATDYVEPVNLDFIAQVFCWYTSFSFRRVPMMDVVSMELSSTIFVRTYYLATISLLNISDNDDDDDYDDDDNDDDDNDEDNDDADDEDDDDDDDDEDDYFDLVVDDDNFDLVVDDDYRTYFDRGSRPASATTVEGLKMVTTEESDSCSICLEDLGMTAPVLAMLCDHLFHPGCLKKWLEQSCSCPLCRFSLPQEQWVSCASIMIKSILIVANLVLAALQAANRMLAVLPAASMRSVAVPAASKPPTALPAVGRMVGWNRNRDDNISYLLVADQMATTQLKAATRALRRWQMEEEEVAAGERDGGDASHPNCSPESLVLVRVAERRTAVGGALVTIGAVRTSATRRRWQRREDDAEEEKGVPVGEDEEKKKSRE
ncbi:hypothetical protein ZIOFF_003299 [Zingiber officinale]|uniref:RING-type domain-containing protein n=1 Tax=Zingiber officinale TaxID=94328 RepID=A0A8J5MA36_ZINOF|nr:hypothetical protein ZIOFF_003299 [Zingiber officinale]